MRSAFSERINLLRILGSTCSIPIFLDSEQLLKSSGAAVARSGSMIASRDAIPPAKTAGQRRVLHHPAAAADDLLQLPGSSFRTYVMALPDCSTPSSAIHALSRAEPWAASPKGSLFHEASACWLSDQATRSYQGLPATPWMDPSSTGEPRRWGALNRMG